MIRRFFFYAFFSLIVFTGFKKIIQNTNLYTPADDAMALRLLNERDFQSITLGLEAYRGVMLATNFLTRPNLYSIEDSYFKTTEFKAQQISERNPLLTSTDSCLLSNATKTTRISPNLVLVTKITPPEKYVYSFSKKSYCSGLTLVNIQGFSGTEKWGTWSDGDKTQFSIKLDQPFLEGGKVLINVKSIINPKIANDERLVRISAGGADAKTFYFTSPKETTIELSFGKRQANSELAIVMEHLNPIRFSDISGEDPRRVSLGFLKVEIKAHNQ
jgi:hypothetical protein